MPVSVSPVPWTGSLLWLVALALASFLVTWIAADRLSMRRTPYIGVLAAMTATLTVGYVAWLGVGVVDLLTTRWVWGIVVGPVAGVFLTQAIRRLPGGKRLRGRRFAVALAWEAVVYGITEGLLLSVLPVLMTWQMVHSLGWAGLGGGIARWTAHRRQRRRDRHSPHGVLGVPQSPAATDRRRLWPDVAGVPGDRQPDRADTGSRDQPRGEPAARVRPAAARTWRRTGVLRHGA